MKLHYYPILLLSVSLLASPLYATHYHNEVQDDYKEASQHTSVESLDMLYSDFTLSGRKKTKINHNKLKQGLIALSQRLKAKDGRKVYFFLGATGVGKSLSIAALQGNAIKDLAANRLYSDALSHTCADNANHPQKSLPKVHFEIGAYVLPKHQVPVVGNSRRAVTNSTYIYYPDPKQPKYKGIAFADTVGFFQQSAAMNADKCLATASLFYALKVNSIGGLVLVVSALDLAHMRGKKGVMRFIDMLETYFPKAISQQNIKESILVLITNVGTSSKAQPVRKFIQTCYQTYYSAAEIEYQRRMLLIKFKNLLQARSLLGENFRNLLKKREHLIVEIKRILEEKKTIDGKYTTQRQERQQLAKGAPDAAQRLKKIEIENTSLLKEINMLAIKLKILKAADENASKVYKKLQEEDKNLLEKIQSTEKKLEKIPLENVHLLKASHRLKLFVEMLLMHDVPKRQVNDIRNFRLDQQRCCFILPARKKSVQYVLDKLLKSLKPIPANLLCNLDTPLLGYIEASIGYFSGKLQEAIQPLLALRRKVDAIERRIAEVQKKQVMTCNLHELINERNRLAKKWQAQRSVKIKAWEATAHMVQFFVDHILQNSDYNVLVKIFQQQLADFGEATQLNSFLTAPPINSNNQASKPRPPFAR